MATANKNLSEYNKADLIDATDLKILPEKPSFM